MEAEGVGSPNNLLYRRDQSYAGNQQQIINTMILGEGWVGEVEGRGGLSLSRVKDMRENILSGSEV